MYAQITDPHLCLNNKYRPNVAMVTKRTKMNAFSTLPIIFVFVESVDFSLYAEETIDPLLFVVS